MSTNLYQAASQWSSRPADERFWTLADARKQSVVYRNSAREAEVHYPDLTAVARGAEVLLLGKTGTEATFTHYAFGQLASRVGAPAGYLRQLPADLAAVNLNHGLQRATRQPGRMMVHQNGSNVIRCFTGEGYSRIWSSEVFAQLMELEDYGWKVPPARPPYNWTGETRHATSDDIVEARHRGGLGINTGDLIAPAGIYASDHDMFVALLSDKRVSDGNGPGLFRAALVSNSEVGAATFSVTTFLFDAVCGNHIFWSVSNVKEVNIVHRGNADMRYARELAQGLSGFIERGESEDKIRIDAAKKTLIAEQPDEVVETLYAKRLASRKVLQLCYDAAVNESHRHEAAGAGGFRPNSVWGMAQGITRHSQETAYADDRYTLDKAAGKLLTMKF